MIKKWPFVVSLLLCAGLAWATDAFFAGRAIRMTRIAASTCAGDRNCVWFDTSNRFRYWNATTSLYVTGSTEGTPTKGKILVGDGTNWVSLAAGSNKQVLTVNTTDGGLPTGLKWVSPTDGGLVLP